MVDSRMIAVRPKRPKAYRDVEGELSTFIHNTTVTVKPEGTIVIKKHTKKQPIKKIAKKETKN